VQLSRAIKASGKLAPNLEAVFNGLGPLTQAARTGIPALEAFLDVSAKSGSGAAKSLFTGLTPYLGQLVPIFDYLGAYRTELASFFANSAASTQGSAPSFENSKLLLHYARASAPLSPQELTPQHQRSYSNRSNAYEVPGGANSLTGTTNALGTALDVFGTYLCTAKASHTLPSIPTVAGSVMYQSELTLFYGGEDANEVPTPACAPQTRLSEALTASLGAGLGPSSGFYPQLKPLP
jgi:hypothetical protein